MTTAADVRCVRCQGSIAPGRRAKWPEGILCHRCYQQATTLRGRCPRCLTDRLLPGLSPTGAPICSDCAALGIDFHCTRCAVEAASYRHGLCPRCCLGDDLGVALDDGTDQINPALMPLQDAVTAQPHPVSGILWLRNPGVADLLHQLATGTLPLDHDSFRNHPHPLMAIHLRDLLITCGILPPIERHTAALPGLAGRAPPRLPSRDAAAAARFRHLAPPAADPAAGRRRHPDTRHHPHRQTGNHRRRAASHPPAHQRHRNRGPGAGRPGRVAGQRPIDPVHSPNIRSLGRSDPAATGPDVPAPANPYQRHHRSGTTPPAAQQLLRAGHRTGRPSRRRDPAAALRPTRHPHQPPAHRRHQRHRTRHVHHLRHRRRARPATDRPADAPTPRRPAEHANCGQRDLAVAVPRPARRAAT